MTSCAIALYRPDSSSARLRERRDLPTTSSAFNAGGPIRKDKTFYFANYEARRRRTGDILQGLIPTVADAGRRFFRRRERPSRIRLNGNIPFPNNVIPQTRFDPISQKLIQYFPHAEFYGTAGHQLTSSHRATGSGEIKSPAASITASPSKGSLFGRYSYANDDLTNVAYIIGLGVIRPDHTQHLSVGYTHIFSPTFISDTRLGFFKAYLARTSDGDRYSKNYAAEMGLKNLAPQPGDYTLPNINLTGYAPGFPGASSGFVGYGTRIVQNNIYYRGSETATWIHGDHTLKIGGDFAHLMVGYDQGSSQNGIINFTGNYSGNSTSDFLLGLPGSATGGLGSFGNFGGVAKYCARRPVLLVRAGRLAGQRPADAESRHAVRVSVSRTADAWRTSISARAANCWRARADTTFPA